MPPINESAAGESRSQLWNTSKLPTGNDTLIFADANCHGSWDSRLAGNAMSDDWDDWLLLNNFSTLNTPESYTRVDTKGHKSSPDITVAPNHWTGHMQWSSLTKRAGGSDHIPLLITIKKPIASSQHRERKRTNKKREKATKWAFKKADWDIFRQELNENINTWPAAWKNWSTHKLNNALTYSIRAAAEESIPRGRRIKPKPFWNSELDKLSRECDDARLNAHLSDADAELFVQKRKEFDKACVEEKTKSWRSFIEGIDPTTDQSKIWKTIAGLDGRKSKNQPGIELKTEEDSPQVAKTDNEKARLFINTYVKASKPPEELKGKSKKEAEKPVIHKMRSATKGCSSCGKDKTGMCAGFSRDELETSLWKAKSGKATGPDQIANEMLKNLSAEGKERLLFLLNKSWQEGVCPGLWKLGEIIPYPKAGKDHQITSSYRPISLLSVIGKLLERLVKTRLEHFLESHNKLDPSQAGFRKTRSTVEQVGRLTQTIYDGFEERNRTLVVYVDFS